MDDDLLKIDGFDKAIIGTASVWKQHGKVETLIYSAEAILEVLMKRDKMTAEEALEFLSFNIEGAYVGEKTPIIMWKIYE
jgi:hypothetical protein